MNDTLQKLHNLCNTDLVGWEIAWCHYLELTHGRMGTFPALYTSDNDIVVTLSEDTLDKVRNILPDRPGHTVSQLMLVNEEEGIAFCLAVKDLENTPPLKLLNEAKFKKLIAEEEEPFKWAPGLL